jgi:DNA-binding NarL/FixJ family response regulator
VVRQGLSSLLSEYSDIHIVGESDGSPGVLGLIAELHPDVVLLDIRLVNHSGLDLAKHLRRSQPEVRVIILTSHDDDSYLLEAARAGVHGYLLKSASAEVLADTIRAVRSGGMGAVGGGPPRLLQGPGLPRLLSSGLFPGRAELHAADHT